MAVKHNKQGFEAKPRIVRRHKKVALRHKKKRSPKDQAVKGSR